MIFFPEPQWSVAPLSGKESLKLWLSLERLLQSPRAPLHLFSSLPFVSMHQLPPFGVYMARFFCLKTVRLLVLS